MRVVLTAIVSACLFLGCQDAQSPTPVSAPAPGSTRGFFESTGARLSYALDLPSGQGPFPALG